MIPNINLPKISFNWEAKLSPFKYYYYERKAAYSNTAEACKSYLQNIYEPHLDDIQQQYMRSKLEMMWNTTLIPQNFEECIHMLKEKTTKREGVWQNQITPSSFPGIWQTWQTRTVTKQVPKGANSSHIGNLQRILEMKVSKGETKLQYGLCGRYCSM